MGLIQFRIHNGQQLYRLALRAVNEQLPHSLEMLQEIIIETSIFSH